MDYVILGGRAGTAPTLASLYSIIVGSDQLDSSGGNIDGGEAIVVSGFPVGDMNGNESDLERQCTDGEHGVYGDGWVNDGDFIVRRHEQARSCLFTPVRVPGAPSTNTISSVRISVGRFCDTGSSFKVVDSWKSPSTARRNLGACWTGATYFCKQGDTVEEPPYGQADMSKTAGHTISVGSSVGGSGKFLPPGSTFMHHYLNSSRDCSKRVSACRQKSLCISSSSRAEL